MVLEVRRCVLSYLSWNKPAAYLDLFPISGIFIIPLLLIYDSVCRQKVLYRFRVVVVSSLRQGLRLLMCLYDTYLSGSPVLTEASEC